MANKDFSNLQYRNVFAELGYSQQEIDKKVNDAWGTIFGRFSPQKFYRNAPHHTGYMVDTGNNDARTEGMSYGMMMAVQMDKKDVFDRLWSWSRKNMFLTEGEGKGYFAWSCALSGKKNAVGPAPDGEEYYALALIFASHRWGNGEGIFNYEQEAKDLLHTMIHHEKFPMWNLENHLIKFVPALDFSDPSYHLPHFYELFALYSNEEDKEFWKIAAKESIKYISIAAHPETGLTPEYANYDGTPHPISWSGEPLDHGNFYSDSYRTVSNIGLYALWTQALNQEVDKDLADVASKVRRFFSTISIEDYMEYKIDGSPCLRKALHPIGLLATLAQSSISAKNDSIADFFVKQFWNTPLRKGKRRYYDNCLYFFALLALSGKYRIW